MSFLKIIFLCLFVIKLSSQKSDRMKWCLEPKYVDADNNDVDIKTCKDRPCIIAICPKGQIWYKTRCENISDTSLFSTRPDFSSIFAIYRIEMDTLVKTGQTLESEHYQIVTLKNKTIHKKKFNNCLTDFYYVGEDQLFDGHFLENGSFLLTDVNEIYPAGEYIVWFTVNRNTLQPQMLLKHTDELPATDEKELVDKVFDYAMLVSVLIIILLLIVYVLCKELRSTAGLVLMTYASELAITYLLVVVRDLALMDGVFNSNSCYVTSTMIHFFKVSSYFWMNIMGFDIWWTLRNMYYGGGGKRGVDYVKFTWYCCIATVPSLVYVIVEVCLDELTKSYGPKFKDCTVDSNMWYEVGLVLFLQAFNFIPFVLTVFNLWRIQKSTQSQLSNSNSGSTGPAKQNALLSIKISVMMGTNWFMDVMLRIFDDDLPNWFKYTAKMYNSLFGVILFLVYIIKWDVFLKLFRRLSIDNELTRKLERRVSRHQSSYKSRKSSQRSDSSSATVMQAVNSQPDTEDTHTD